MRIRQRIGIALVLVATACGNSESDSLTSLYSHSGGGQGPTAGSTAPGVTTKGGSDAGAGSSTTGSTAIGDGGSAAATFDAAVEGRVLFEALLPSFETTCGGPCHQAGGLGAPAYLGGTDPYTTIKSYQGMIEPLPSESILVTKGQHEGPALTGALETSITAWLTVEAEAAAAAAPPVTAPITVATGANTVDLSSLGVAGLSLGFTASVSGDILSLASLAITAPAATGVQLASPIFYVNASGGTQTENDDLSNVSQTLAAGTSAPLGTGLLIITGWAATDTLQVSFTKLATATVSTDAGLSGGCKSVATFTADAVPAIQANTCLNCHNTGGSGNAAMDLSALAATPPDYATACAQALPRIDPTNPAQSQIILAPTGGLPPHPFTSAPASFVTMMETWIQAEN